MAMLTLVLSLVAALPTHADVAFNEANFPDATFRSWLSSNFAEAVADGVWTDAELATVTDIHCSSANLESMVGIEHFSNLQKLTSYGTKMTQLDLSKNHNLAEVVIESSQLRALNVANTALTKLWVTDNKLASLNCEGLDNLNNNTNTGYPPQTVALDKVYKMDYNGKTYYFVWLEEEHKNLDQSLAEQMRAYEGDMGNGYVHFDPERADWGSGCEVFEGTPVAGGLSDGLDANAFPGKVLLLNPESKTFTYNYDATPSRPRKKIPLPVHVTWENAVYTTAIGGIPFDEEHFPDANFRANLARNLVAETADNWLTPEELTCEKTKSLILNFYKDMESMEGIQYFTELEDVNFIGTKVKSVDLSQNTKLKSVSCWYSGLMSLDLSNNTALTSADIDPQRVSGLPVNKITVNGKDYYYITIPNFRAFVNDYEGEMRETYVPFSLNRITWGDNCERFNGTPVAGGLSEGLSANTFNGPVLLINPEQKSFTYYYDVNNQVESDGKMEVIVKWVPAETPLDGIPFDEEHFPDAAFRSALASAFPDETADLFWTYAELATVSQIDCMNKSIVSMKGIEYFTELVLLRCYNNALGQDDQPLDLSSNVALQSLVGWNNYDLKQIILPETESLTTVHVSSCALTSLDVTKNPNLESLKCTNNQLKTLDLTQNTKLRILACGGNHLTSLDLSNNQLLTAYNIDNQTVNLGECSGSVKRDGTDKKYFFGLKESYKDDIVKSLPKLINDWEAQHTETFVNFNLNRVDWVDGCYYVGSNGHGAPRRAQLEWTPEYPILILTDEPNENEFTYDYRVNIPNDQEKKMTVKATYQKPKDDDLLIDTSTAIDTVTADADVVSVRYINVSGVSSNEPWDGVNIVVTTKADGTQSVTKVLR